MENNKEEKKTLYCFKVVEDANEKVSLECCPISDYIIRKRGIYDNKEAIFKGRLVNMTTANVHVDLVDFDRYLHGKVYTFDLDCRHAEDIISASLKDKRYAAKLKLTQLEKETTRWCDYIYDKYRD